MSCFFSPSVRSGDFQNIPAAVTGWDSWWIVLDSIPIIGDIVELAACEELNEVLRTEHLSNQASKNRAIRIIDIKNSYKACGVLRICLSITTLVLFLFLTKNSYQGIAGGIGCLSLLIGKKIHDIYQNKKAIEVLKAPGAIEIY